jgi:hypothetical protein
VVLSIDILMRRGRRPGPPWKTIGVNCVGCIDDESVITLGRLRVSTSVLKEKSLGRLRVSTSDVVLCDHKSVHLSFRHEIV